MALLADGDSKQIGKRTFPAPYTARKGCEFFGPKWTVGGTVFEMWLGSL